MQSYIPKRGRQRSGIKAPTDSPPPPGCVSGEMQDEAGCIMQFCAINATTATGDGRGALESQAVCICHCVCLQWMHGVARLAQCSSAAGMCYTHTPTHTHRHTHTDTHRAESREVF